MVLLFSVVYEPRSYKLNRELVRYKLIDILLTCLELSSLPRSVGLGYSANNGILFNRTVVSLFPTACRSLSEGCEE